LTNSGAKFDNRGRAGRIVVESAGFIPSALLDFIARTARRDLIDCSHRATINKLGDGWCTPRRMNRGTHRPGDRLSGATPLPLAGKTVLFTNATSSIGAEIALTSARKDAKVVDNRTISPRNTLAVTVKLLARC